MTRSIVCLSAAFLLAALSCKGKDSPKDDTKWPAQPKDGTPLVFEFVELVGEGRDVRAKMHLFNFTDKTVSAASMTLHYQDGEGTDLKTFPWSHQTAGGLVGKKGHAFVKMGAFMPDGTEAVVVELREVRFEDGSAWQK